jgi:hypothetical protein
MGWDFRDRISLPMKEIFCELRGVDMMGLLVFGRDDLVGSCPDLKLMMVNPKRKISIAGKLGLKSGRGRSKI